MERLRHFVRLVRRAGEGDTFSIVMLVVVALIVVLFGIVPALAKRRSKPASPPAHVPDDPTRI